MGIKKKLSLVEMGQIDAFFDQKTTVKDIANKLGRSRGAISNYLKQTTKHNQNLCLGRPRALSLRTRNAIIKFSKNKVITANQIKDNFDLTVSKNTILSVLKNDGKLKRRKTMKKPVLRSHHKLKRLEFAEEYVDFKENWSNVIFSDEKKFNLDGPDGYNYYWYALKSKPIFCSRRANGGGSVMVWACFCKNGKSQIEFINGSINGEKYVNTLDNYLLPFIHAQNNSNIIFQQDNARPHVSDLAKNWFIKENINCLPWPAYSPDLNPIENLWGVLVQRVYANGAQFSSVDQLKSKIKLEWENIDKKILEAEINSMKKRLVEVLKSQGGTTKY